MACQPKKQRGLKDDKARISAVFTAVDTDGKHSVVRSTPTGGAERLFRIFDAVPDADRVIPAKNTMPYFL